nr:cbb3-type cytochrome oxidase assembly protein CcoS [Pseudomaricurvus sp. HS19]
MYLLIPIALVFVVLAIRALFWAVNSGQYDDLNTEGQRILFEEEKVAPKRPDSPVGSDTDGTSSPATGNPTGKSSSD